MRQSFKYRFYPSPKQRLQLAKDFGCARFVYNWALQARKERWQKEGRRLGYNELSKLLTRLRSTKELSWLADGTREVQQQALRNLDRAFNGFFNKKSQFPHFKKRKVAQRITYCNGFYFSGSELRLNKLGAISIRWSRPLAGTPTSLSVSRNGADEYYVSIVCECRVSHAATSDCSIGIDLGLKTFAVTSAGVEIHSPRPLNVFFSKLQRLQRSVSKKDRGSRRREKSKQAVARLHNRIANIRTDFIHKLTTKIIRENQTIAIEDLAVKNMVKNKRLSRAISDAGWGEFQRQLKYKAAWYGRTLIEVPRFYPSSKLCSECGQKTNGLTLSIREWDCLHCGAHHDRDHNAAKNILAAALSADKTLVEVA